MKDNCNNVMFDIRVIDSMMYSFENTYLDCFAQCEDPEMGDMATYAFYGIWNAIKGIRKELEELTGNKISEIPNKA